MLFDFFLVESAGNSRAQIKQVQTNTLCACNIQFLLKFREKKKSFVLPFWECNETFRFLLIFTIRYSLYLYQMQCMNMNIERVDLCGWLWFVHDIILRWFQSIFDSKSNSIWEMLRLCYIPSTISVDYTAPRIRCTGWQNQTATTAFCAIFFGVFYWLTGNEEGACR